MAVLCATEIISWGTLFYALPVLASTIHTDEGWALSHVIAALTIAQLVAAVVGVWVGRRMDLHGPRRLMTAGSVVGVLALVWVSVAPGLGWFYAAWVLAGGPTPPAWRFESEPELLSGEPTPQVREQYAAARDLVVERQG